MKCFKKTLNEILNVNNVYKKLIQRRLRRIRRRRRLTVMRPTWIGGTCSTLWHVYDHLTKLFIGRSLLCRFCCVLLFELCVRLWYLVAPLLQGHKLLRLGARYWLGAPDGWGSTGRPQVVGPSVGEPVNPILIRSTWRSSLHPQIRIKFRMGRRLVPVCLPQPIIIGLLKIKLKSNHHIQFNKHNNNLQNKMVE